MSEQSGGPGWWQASDGKWYPPEQAPTGQQPSVDPTATQPAAGAPGYGAPAAAGTPAYAAPAAAAGGGGAGKIIAIVVVLALLAGGGAYLLTKGDGGGNSLKDFCNTAKVLNADPELNGNNFDNPATVDKVVSAFSKLNSSAPNEIKADTTTVLDGIKKAAAALKAGKSPDSALSQTEQDKFNSASGRVETFVEAKCGFSLNGSSGSSTDSSSFDASSFTDSLSSEFSSFDTSSLSSELSSLCDQFGTEFGTDFCSSS